MNTTADTMNRAQRRQLARAQARPSRTAMPTWRVPRLVLASARHGDAITDPALITVVLAAEAASRLAYEAEQNGTPPNLCVAWSLALIGALKHRGVAARTMACAVTAGHPRAIAAARDGIDLDALVPPPPANVNAFTIDEDLVGPSDWFPAHLVVIAETGVGPMLVDVTPRQFRIGLDVVPPYVVVTPWTGIGTTERYDDDYAIVYRPFGRLLADPVTLLDDDLRSTVGVFATMTLSRMTELHEQLLGSLRDRSAGLGVVRIG